MKLERTLAMIDAKNAEDPNFEVVDGEPQPKELVYGRRMSARLGVFAPEAADVVAIAVRAQHIQRWKSPRDSYPRTRKGYLQWRHELYGMHADLTAEIMRELGWDAESIERVGHLLRKKALATDPDTQLLEDVACLVFLEHYLSGFAEDHTEEKVIGILQKTWGKMSRAAQRAALELELGETRVLIDRALAG